MAVNLVQLAYILNFIKPELVQHDSVNLVIETWIFLSL